MALLSVNRLEVGKVGVTPGIVLVNSTDSLSTVTTAGYLNSQNLAGTVIYSTDLIGISYSGDSAWFNASISTSGVITLASLAPIVTLPTIANHIATFTDTVGTLGEDAATAINGGNIQAGLSGTAGYFASFPSTASTGSLRLVAASNSGNTVTQITNASFAQASVLTIPDPGATANFCLRPSALVNNNLVKASGVAGLLVDAGARIISNTTGSYGGGGTSNTFTATGLTSGAKGSAVIRTSTNSVSITKAVPGTDTLAITFSADPGASTTVDYIYTTASQA